MTQLIFSTVKKLQNALNVWNTRTLTLEGRIIIFKALGISKIIYFIPFQYQMKFRKLRKLFYGTLQNLKLITRHSGIRL